MDFIDSNGLINSRPEERKSENSPLISLEYILVRKLLGKDTPDMNTNLHNFINECKIREGLYNQRDFIVGNGCPEDQMSHDQLTTFSAFSFMTGFEYHKHIWEEIKRQNMKYDNINPKAWKRFLHLRDVIFYGILNNNFLAEFTFPVFAQMMKISCRNDSLGNDGLPATSGKLLAFTRCVSVMDKLPKFEKLFYELTDIIRDNESVKSWERVFEVYYPYENHPIRLAISQGGESEKYPRGIFQGS